MCRAHYGYLAASLVLIVFYCYVVGLVFSPSPSPNYRLYYLEHKLKYWPQRDGLHYAFGTIIDFRDIVDYAGAGGWSYPTRTGTWVDGRKATLYLRTRPFSNARVILCATVRRDARFPRHLPRTVRIRINGRLVDTWPFGTGPRRQAGWMALQSMLPAGTMSGGGLQRLSFLIGRDGREARLEIGQLQLMLDPTGGGPAPRCRIDAGGPVSRVHIDPL